MYMVMLVLDNPDLLDSVLEEWDQNGITGATIIESSGFNRRLKKNLLIPIRYNLPQMQGEITPYHYTLFAVVPAEENAARALQAAEKITGDLDNPNTGIFAAWPVPLVKGVSAHPSQ
jgi:hypothetical protein